MFLRPTEFRAIAFGNFRHAQHPSIRETPSSRVHLRHGLAIIWPSFGPWRGKNDRQIIFQSHAALLLTIGSFLLTAELFCFQLCLGVFLLTKRITTRGKFTTHSNFSTLRHQRTAGPNILRYFLFPWVRHRSDWTLLLIHAVFLVWPGP